MKNNNSKNWWLKEPLLMHEVCMSTLPGFSFNNHWQDHIEPDIEVEYIKATYANQTHGLSFMVGHLSNRICYFKSNNFKEPHRDYLGRYLNLSRKAGYRTLVYFNTHAIKPEFGADYPEWKQIRYDGSTIEDLYGVETAFCVNSPWRDWVRSVCLDLCQYPIDGILFDGPCLFANACYCKYCKDLYYKKYGKEMPPKKPGHPELKELADFQSDSLREFFKHSNDAIKSLRPNVALYGNSGPREEPYYIVGRNNRVLIKDQDILIAEGGFVYGELSGQPVWKQGSNAKYYQTQANGKPTMVANSPAHGPWRSYYITEAELRLANIQPVVHGSGIWFSSFYWFKEQPEFKEVAKDYKFFSTNKEYYFNTRSKSRVAIVWPENSLNFYNRPTVLHGDFTQGGVVGEDVGNIGDEFNGFYDALIKSHIPCDIIDEYSVENEDISKYDLIILPNVSCTGEKFDNNIRRYVKEGGNIIASFETSMCKENGEREESPSLEDLFGIKILRTPVIPYPHFYFLAEEAEKDSVFKDINVKLLPAPLISVELALRGGKMLSPYSKKFKGWDGSEIVASEFPAMTIHTYGEGNAIYLAGVFGQLYWKYKQKDIRLLLRNLFQQLSEQHIYSDNLPTSVELVYREDIKQNREIVSLINYTGGLTRPFENITELMDINLTIKTIKGTAKTLVSGKSLPVKKEEGTITLKVPYLSMFETIIVE